VDGKAGPSEVIPKSPKLPFDPSDSVGEIRWECWLSGPPREASEWTGVSSLWPFLRLELPELVTLIGVASIRSGLSNTHLDTLTLAYDRLAKLEPQGPLSKVESGDFLRHLRDKLAAALRQPPKRNTYACTVINDLKHRLVETWMLLGQLARMPVRFAEVDEPTLAKLTPEQKRYVVENEHLRPRDILLARWSHLAACSNTGLTLVGWSFVHGQLGEFSEARIAFECATAIFQVLYGI
jgi:hypothetical protein